jgi:hypothetical protein
MIGLADGQIGKDVIIQFRTEILPAMDQDVVEILIENRNDS